MSLGEGTCAMPGPQTINQTRAVDVTFISSPSGCDHLERVRCSGAIFLKTSKTNQSAATADALQDDSAPDSVPIASTKKPPKHQRFGSCIRLGEMSVGLLLNVLADFLDLLASLARSVLDALAGLVRHVLRLVRSPVSPFPGFVRRLVNPFLD